MKHFRPRTLIALFPALLIVLCFLVNCIGEQWFDDGEKYLCPECKYRQFYDYGFICERCGASIPYSPVIYCYDCAKELNCCQRCGIERWWCLLKCQNVKHRPSDSKKLFARNKKSNKRRPDTNPTRQRLLKKVEIIRIENLKIFREINKIWRIRCVVVCWLICARIMSGINCRLPQFEFPI